MSQEQNDAPQTPDVESADLASTANVDSVDPTSSTDASSAELQAETEDAPHLELEGGDEAKKKPARKPRASKAKAEKAQTPKAESSQPAKAAKPTAPARTRRRSAREPGEPAPVVRAQAKYVRSSARKARLVCDNIRGKSVEDARAILAHTPRAVARDWSKLLESAVANAEHNHALDGEDLIVQAVHADEGPTIKRFRPRAQGRATPIRKRTAHLTILLTSKN